MPDGNSMFDTTKGKNEILKRAGMKEKEIAQKIKMDKSTVCGTLGGYPALWHPAGRKHLLKIFLVIILACWDRGEDITEEDLNKILAMFAAAPPREDEWKEYHPREWKAKMKTAQNQLQHNLRPLDREDEEGAQVLDLLEKGPSSQEENTAEDNPLDLVYRRVQAILDTSSPSKRAKASKLLSYLAQALSREDDWPLCARLYRFAERDRRNAEARRQQKEQQVPLSNTDNS